MNNGVKPFNYCYILLAYTPITMIHRSLLTVLYLNSIFHDALCMKSFHIPGGINYSQINDPNYYFRSISSPHGDNMPT